MDGNSQIYLPRLSRINKTLIIVVAALFILEIILQKSSGLNLSGWLGLSAAHFFSGHLYSVVTYPLLSNSIIEVILNCLMLWLMGSEFEESWGPKRYISFLLTVVIGGGLLYLGINALFFQGHAVFNFPLTGLSGIVSSLCVAYAVIFPDRVFSFMMVIPVKARYFCWILVVISLFQGISGPMYAGTWGQLGGIVAAYLFMVVVSHRNFKMLSQKVGQMTQLKKSRKGKAKLTIVKDDNDVPPKYWQ